MTVTISRLYNNYGDARGLSASWRQLAFRTVISASSRATLKIGTTMARTPTPIAISMGKTTAQKLLAQVPDLAPRPVARSALSRAWA